MEVALNSSLCLHPLHGVLETDGFRLSLWRGRTARPQRLDSQAASGAPVLALSFAGTTELQFKGASYTLKAEQALLLNEHARPFWTATGGHRLLLLEIRRDLMRQMGGSLPLRPLFETFLRSGEGELIAPFKASQNILSLAQELTHPPAHLVSLPVWYRAKVLELAALLFYSPEESGNAAGRSRTRHAQQLVQRAAFLLERDLENPPSLEMLAQELGCSAFQLSRYFAAHMDCTMPEFLRRKRMERAASLLHTTMMAVSEIALTVGYTSFSAFTRAFVREHRLTPTAFKQQRTAQM